MAFVMFVLVLMELIQNYVAQGSSRLCGPLPKLLEINESLSQCLLYREKQMLNDGLVGFKRRHCKSRGPYSRKTAHLLEPTTFVDFISDAK